ncbi:MAG: PA4780 family RIO1-like protein kinase [Gammaproteobacteria bacterium]
MKTPARLAPLVEDGLVDEVIRPLKSGKEAAVFLVRCGDEIRCAKVYKDAAQRSFRQAVQYTEGRKVRSSRLARAMEKGSRYGKQQQEAHWQNAEVAALYRLAAAGVRVPKPYGCFDGVLLMEMIADDDGGPAGRLADFDFTPEDARDFHRRLVREVVRMLCAGLIHGDLSEYNILVDADGPVIIDLPQAVDAAGNNHAKAMLARDIANLAEYFSQYAPELADTDYAGEIWDLYERGELTPDSPLTGEFVDDSGPTDLDGLLREIQDAIAEEAARKARAAEDPE